MAEEKNVYKIVTITLAVVAVILAGVLIYVWTDRNSMIDDLTIEKDQLTEQMEQLKGDYATLSSTNDSINMELDREREKVEQLLDRVKKTEAKNKAKLRQYEKELGTLRSVMRHYVVQIDSLNTLNNQLRAEASQAREEARKSKRQYEQVRETADEYAKQIEKGAQVKGRAVSLEALSAKGKETDRSSRTVKLKVNVTLVENSIAKTGYRMVYVRIKDPDGILMADGQDQIFSVNGEQLIYSEKREVDYQGAEVDLSIYYQTAMFAKGVYTAEVYTEDGLLGSADLLLK